MVNAFTSFLTKHVEQRYRVLAWVVGVIAVTTLGVLHTATETDYAFSSAVIIPVVAVAWTGGRRDGFSFSLLAALLWVSADVLAERQFSSGWVPLINGLTRFATYGFVTYLIVEVQTLLARVQEMARHDTLTTLLNRGAFFEAGDAEASRCQRYGHHIAVAFLDLDDFKHLNDSRGHGAGDRALKAVAVALQSTLRTTDYVARLGGDEFAVLLPEIGYNAAAEAGHKIAAAVNSAMKEFAPVSVSVGIAWFENAECGFPAMLGSADALMYEIKRDGKHGVRTRRGAVTLPDPPTESETL